MINTYDVLETIRMIQDDCLDIRTITMGISLLDCIDSDINVACENVYKKITAKAARLVEVGEQIEKELGIPIINKRISVTPIAIVSAACKCSPVPFAHAMDRAAKDVGVNLIGGYTALVPKGFSAGDIELIKSIPEALATTERVCSSVNIGSTKTGINLDACKIMGGIVRECAERTVDSACFGAAKLVVFCNAVEDNPFMAGAFHGVGEPDCMINVGVSGPGVVRAALRKYPDADITKISDVIKEISYKITRVGQLVGTIASKRLGVPFGIVDLSLAPTPAVGDSVAHILEEIGLEKCGTHGTTAALALLNDAVKKGGDRQELHEKIRQHSMAAGAVVKVEGGKNDLVDRIAADPAFMTTKEEILAILKPANFVGRAPEQTADFLSEVIKPILDKEKDLLGIDVEINV